ncbi:cytochrome D1 domain-containing protein [Roseovarius sp. 2305UL8-3]|uniref:cytochrome D1 domain-containing protein n=1 Tax=Roseovarius conchicola TaxID=3121636 RepID=UPI003528CB5F
MHLRALIIFLCVGLATTGLADSQWNAAQIEASRVVQETGTETDAPNWLADPANLLLIEAGVPPSLHLLDGRSFEVFGRIDPGFALQGQPVADPDGRYLFRLSSDGWVQKIDLRTLSEVVRVRAGLISRNMAFSHDGKWLAVANDAPNTLTILSASDLSVAKVHQVVDKHDTPSGVVAVATRPTQESFVLTLSDVYEIHEVFYGPNPPFYGFVHDYRIEGPPDETEAFPMRYITVPELLGDFQFDPSFEYVMAAVQNGPGAAVVDLVIGHKIAAPEMPGVPDWASAVTWQQGDQGVTAVPHLAGSGVSVMDLKTWKVIRHITTDAPVVAMQSHDNLPVIWVIAGDTVQVIDKQTFDTLKTFRPLPGAMPSEMIFTRDGAHALITFAEADVVIVLDTKTLALVRRLKMSRPSLIYGIGR